VPNLNKRQFDPDNPQPYFTKSGVGKLFPDPKPTDEHRYQRGYTPERQREVAEVLPQISGPEEVTPLEGLYPYSPDFDAMKASKAGFREGVRGALTRSTMPVEDISKIDEITQKPPPSIDFAFGIHDRPLARRRIRISSDTGSHESVPSLGPTVVHEAGHAQDENLWRAYDHTDVGPVARSRGGPENPYKALPPTIGMEGGRSWASMTQDEIETVKRSKGAAEKFADDYMLEHYRPDPREKSAVTNVEHTYPGRGTPVVKYEGWHDRAREAVLAKDRRGGRGKHYQDPMFEPVDPRNVRSGTHPGWLARGEDLGAPAQDPYRII